MRVLKTIRSRFSRGGLAVLAGISLLAPLPVSGGIVPWSGGLPEGGEVASLAVDPSAPATVYASGTPTWRSTDSGTSWAPTDPATRRLDELVVDGSGVVYGVPDLTQETVIYRSTDGGASWTTLDPGAGEPIDAVEVDPSNSAILYAGTEDSGIFKSVDSGASWGAVNNGLGDVDNLRIESIQVDPTNSQVVYAAADSVGVFKTVDGGALWTPVNTGINLPFRDPRLLIDPSTPTTVYAGHVGGVYKSVDGAATWADSGTGLPSDNSLESFAIDPSTPATLYAGGYGEIYATSDAGGSWAPLSTGLPATRVDALAVDPTDSTKVYAGTQKGIVRSTDGGASWQDADSGHRNYFADNLLVDPTNLDRVMARDFRSGLYESTDGGATWQSRNGDLPSLDLVSLALAPAAPQTLFTATYTEIYRTLDNGVTWSPRIADPGDFGDFGPQITQLLIENGAGTTLLAGNTVLNLPPSPLPPGLLRSTDGGANWSPLYTPDDIPDLDFYWEPWDIAFDPADPNRIFVSAYYQSTTGPTSMRVVRTENGGASWDEVFTGGFGLARVAVDPHDPLNVFLGVFGIDPEPDEVYKSTDGGDTFLPQGVGLPCVYTLALHPTQPDTVYAGCDTVRVSIDGGDSWSDVPSDGLPPNPLGYVGSALAIVPQTPTGLHFGSYQGVYSRTWEVEIFTDGFESGDTSAWSNTIP